MLSINSYTLSLQKFLFLIQSYYQLFYITPEN